MHQKHPPAKVAVSIAAGDMAGREKAAMAGSIAHARIRVFIDMLLSMRPYS
jgi:hypothetical protein